jgi:TonB family protein
MHKMKTRFPLSLIALLLCLVSMPGIASHEDTKPILTTTAAVSYPEESRKLNEQGDVVIDVLVNEDGTPLETNVRSSSGYPRLDKAALGAAKHWRFKPALDDGKPVDAWISVPMRFHINTD